MSRHLITAMLLVALGGCQGMSSKSEPSASASSSSEAHHKLFTPDAIKWEAGPASLPPGAQTAVLEGDPTKPGFFVMRARLPANYRIPPHWHPRWERVTVISGTLYLGAGERFDEPAARAMAPGSYSAMSPGMRHFAFTREPTEIQLATNGPWGIHYLNPNDDPRRQAR